MANLIKKCFLKGTDLSCHEIVRSSMIVSEYM